MKAKKPVVLGEEGKLWEVTLSAQVFPRQLPHWRKVKVRAWTGAAAEAIAVESDPLWTPIVQRTKVLEEA